MGLLTAVLPDDDGTKQVRTGDIYLISSVWLRCEVPCSPRARRHHAPHRPRVARVTAHARSMVSTAAVLSARALPSLAARPKPPARARRQKNCQNVAGARRTATWRPRVVTRARDVAPTVVARAAGDDEGGASSDDEVRIPRDNLDRRYYEGFLTSDVGENDNASGRDKLTASMKLAVGGVESFGRTPAKRFRRVDCLSTPPTRSVRRRIVTSCARLVFVPEPRCRRPWCSAC